MIDTSDTDIGSELTYDKVWGDWVSLQGTYFSGIHEKIRDRRRMYKLDWTPSNMDARSAKVWQDFIKDPLPRSDIDFKADRLTMRPLRITIPTDQLNVDTVDILNNHGAFQGLPPGVDIVEISKKLKETAREIAQKRADSIEKFLNGTLYINQTLRKEHLNLRWAMHLLVDGYGSYMTYYDKTASWDEYPIVLRAIDPLTVVYTRGDQKLDKLIIGNQDTVFNLRRQFGDSMFYGKTENDIVYVIDYWCRKKVKSRDPTTAEEIYNPVVYHCTYLGSTGISGDPWITGSGPDRKVNREGQHLGWALSPTKTDYFEIPGDVIEARTTALTEDREEMVASDLDAAKEIWEGRNYFLTRLHRQAKLGSNADLITKGIQGEILQHIGKGEGATVSIPQDSPVMPGDAISWSKPPPADPNMQMLDLNLNQMLQQTLIPITSLGNRGGTVSGAQVDTLDQGAAVRLQTFVNAMNLLHTSWCRSVMQIAQIFFKDDNKRIPIYGIDQKSNPFATSIAASDINGNFTVFAECNPRTNMELLQEALVALRLTSADPTQTILSKQTIRENYLNVGYNWEEEQRIKREAVEFNANQIKVSSMQMISQAQLQILANLENLRVQSILQGAPPNPIIMAIMQQLQKSLLEGVIPQTNTQAATAMGGQGPGGLILPTNEGMAPDNRTYEPTNNSQMMNTMQASMARNGQAMPSGM